MRGYLYTALLSTFLMAVLGYLLILLNPISSEFSFFDFLDTGWISTETGRPVASRIASAAWPTLILFFLGSLLSFLIGIPLGVAMGIGKGEYRLLRWILSLLSMLPALLTGFLLIHLFAVELKIVPLSGIQSMRFAIGSEAFGGSGMALFDILHHAALPALVVAIADGNLVYVLRSSASAVESHKKMGYVSSLELLGIRRRTLVLRYFSRSALVQALAAFRIQLPMVVGGLVVVEKIFSIPGLGRLLVRAVEYNDVPLLWGLILVLSIATGLAYLLFAFLQYLLDPRLRFGLEDVEQNEQIENRGAEQW